MTKNFSNAFDGFRIILARYELVIFKYNEQTIE